MLNPMADQILTPERAALELIRRNKMRESLIGFALNIDIPGAPTKTEEEEADLERRMVAGESLETGMAAHHLLLLKKLQATMERPYGRLMVFMPPGSAKALALDTPIPTPSGWCSMGDLEVGDTVFDERGEPCRIVRKSPVFRNRPVYAVRTDCGDEIIADEDHLWRVCLCRKPRKAVVGGALGRPPLENRDDPATRFTLVETRDLARKRSKRPMIERAGALRCTPQDLPIDPYVLGVWLGDGHNEAPRFTLGEDDQEFVIGEFERRGYKVSRHKEPKNFSILGVRDQFVQLGLLGSKHIPERYLRGSEEQRIDLLQGLIDTDGTVCKKRGCATFSNTNLVLAKAVRELVRSLGMKAGWSESRAKVNGKDCGPVYRVSFYYSLAAKLPRKAVLCRNQQRTPNTYVEAERLWELRDTVCIEVDSPSHLFLAGRSMTPTHNSTYTDVIAPTWYMGANPGSRIILASYGTDLAKKHGGKARQVVEQRRYYDAFRTTLSKATGAREMWALENGSEYMSGGLLSGITGNRANGVIVDDPVKGRQEADSETTQQTTLAAFQDDLKTRFLPKAWMILIQTRWHPNDLAGSILPEDYAGESGLIMCRDGMIWDVLNIRAKIENEIHQEQDPLGRKIGEYLWPEWFDAEHWAQYEPRPDDPNSPDERTWKALFQGDPRPDSGMQFNRDWVNWYDLGRHPKYLNVYSSSDYSFSDGSGDFTEHGIGGLDAEGDLWLLDWYYGQVPPDEGVDALLTMARRWNCRHGFDEGGTPEKAIRPWFESRSRQLNWHMQIEYLPSVGNKRARFQSFRGLASAGKLHVPRCPWGERLVDHLCAFTGVNDKRDDVPDVCSGFGRGLEEMVWSRERIPEPPKKGLVFGSWEWLTHGTEGNDRKGPRVF